jgi:hypothetical protein
MNPKIKSTEAAAAKYILEVDGKVFSHSFIIS